MPTEVLADDKALREARRRRAFAEMEAHDIDVMLLGHEANARYVSGAQRLWMAGTRPFGPGCVVVRKSRAIHLVSTWDEGIPDDIPREHLCGITWNPGNLVAWLKGIDGLAAARRIGTDSLTPRFAQLLAKIFPSAELVDAEPAMQAARRVKTPGELGAIRTSISVTEAALGAAVDELRPGLSVRHLSAVFMEAMAEQGVTTPATQRVAWIASGPGRSRGHGENSVLERRDLVAFDAGVVAQGYISQVGRTWPVSARAVDPSTRDQFRRADDLWDRLLGACQAGTSCRGLLATYEAVGHRLPLVPIASGLGLGFDLPVVAAHLPETAATEQLVPGMVLAVTAHLEEDLCAVLRKEVVHITDEGPEVLTSSERWHP